jgi:nucleotide-binding universal stress UspA family protein
MFDVITVPIDESEYAEKAIDIAIDLASKYNSKIAAVHVIDESSLFTYADLEDNGNNLLSKISIKAKEKNIDVVEHLITGDALRDIEVIIRKTSADLVVLPAYGNDSLIRGIDKTNFIGSVAERLIKTSNVPVLLVK